jgi:hypothetical protein
MRLWHLIVLVFCLGTVFGIARSEIGRVALIVFFTGLGEMILGTTALMHLFKSLGAFGHARGLLAHVEALAATALILLAATVSMNAVLWVGVALLQRAVGQW